MTHNNPTSTRLDSSFFPALFLFVSMTLLLLILRPPSGKTTVPSVDATATARSVGWAATQTAVAQITPLAPESAKIGRWQWTSFSTQAEVYPPAQLWMDVDAGGVTGVLSIYPNNPDIPQAALTLIQQNGCNYTIDSLNGGGVEGFFYSPTQAFIQIHISECTVKFYGPVTLVEPLVGAFDVAYDDEMTQLILNPRELTPIERGQQVFKQYCSGCHGSYAEGLPGIPSLHTDQVRAYTDEQLDAIVRNGVVNTTMPAWGNVLTPLDFDGVIELVRNIDILGQ